jgi:hypothetical protein
MSRQKAWKYSAGIALLFDLTPFTPAGAACSVGISGGTPTMNVGERATFTATVAGGGTPVTYQWAVTGNIIREYSESTQFPWSVTAMAPADFQRSSLSFYWKPDSSQVHPLNGGPVNRTVSVTARAGADICTAQTVISVERNNTNINFQAEDFYVSRNHRLSPTTTMTRVMNEHRLWHANNVPTSTTYDGTLFFDFHNQYLSRFNSWRAEFGYPPLVEWNTGTAFPTGIDVNHSARNASYTPYPKPTWFTSSGGGGTRNANGRPCDSGGGQNDLFDFPTRAHLGCAATIPYHDTIHQRIGGDMGTTSFAPRDPIFWRWHTYLNGVSQEWLAGPSTPLASAPKSSLFARIVNALIPTAIAQSQAGQPQVIYQTPFRLFYYITELPSISVTFSKPVVGVKASDLTVNGSPATQVTGEGAGPYTFTGFRDPGKAAVANVKIDTGEITDSSGLPFGGDSWKYRLVQRGRDSDGDGLKNEEEASTFLTNPLSRDTDGDGLPDNFEIANSCLDALENQLHPHDMSGNPLPAKVDADGDGIPDVAELNAKTNPCARR